MYKEQVSSDYEAFSHCITSLDILELGTVILQLIVKKGCLNNTVYWENMLLELLQAKWNFHVNIFKYFYDPSAWVL